jgi:hypothetical protein
MEKLKIGDKVFNKKSSRYSAFTDYSFGEVVRLTKTQAILNNGIKLINEPTTDWNSKDICFCLYGDRYTKWFFQNEEIIKEANKEILRKKIHYWFIDKKFTDQEKEQVYNLLQK